MKEIQTQEEYHTVLVEYNRLHTNYYTLSTSDREYCIDLKQFLTNWERKSHL